MPDTANALVLVPVIELNDEWIGYDPRHLSHDGLRLKLASCAPGTGEHAALLAERRRRYERQRAVRMEEV